MTLKIKVKLVDVIWEQGDKPYTRTRNEAPIYGIFCPSCTPPGQEPLHVIQHREPGPAMDFARMHHWQHGGNPKSFIDQYSERNNVKDNSYV